MNDVRKQAELAHDEVELLLPFLANGSLDAEERRQVTEHVRSCLGCRRRLREEHRLLEAFRAPSLVPVDVASDTFERTLARVRSSDVGVTGVATPTSTVAARAAWVRYTFAAAALLVLAVTVRTLAPGASAPESRFHTLASDRQAPRGVVFVIFAPQVEMVEVNALLRAHDAELVAGPNAAGAYTVRPTGAPGALLDALRQAPEVVAVAAADAP